jgi:16S rRNA G966 N2-methylase RsmD
VDAAAISHALRTESAISDAEFDRLFPNSQRMRSRSHWTPIDTARRACALLAPVEGSRVLDVGSGVGKLCLVGALTRNASWVGVESEARMIRAAEGAARRLGIEQQVAFRHGDATSFDWAEFDAIYLYNPFAEELFRTGVDAMERRERYIHAIERAQHCLAATTPRTRIVTYHGFGGDMPEGFELVHREPAHEDQLCLWVRTTRRHPSRRS